MTEAEYKAALAKVINIARSVEEIDLSAMLKVIGHSEALAPVIDPTLYRKAMDNLHAIKRLIEALVLVKKCAHDLRDSVFQTMARGDMRGMP